MEIWIDHLALTIGAWGLLLATGCGGGAPSPAVAGGGTSATAPAATGDPSPPSATASAAGNTGGDPGVNAADAGTPAVDTTPHVAQTPAPGGAPAPGDTSACLLPEMGGMRMCTQGPFVATSAVVCRASAGTASAKCPTPTLGCCVSPKQTQCWYGSAQGGPFRQAMCGKAGLTWSSTVP
jgi:hypothetical protein